jgi:hypothetical protein
VLVRGGARKRDAAKRAAQATGIPSTRIYEALTTKRYGTDAGSNSASRGRRAESSE